MKYLGLRLPSYYERQRLRNNRAIEPIEFRAVRRNPFKAQTKVTMVNSVHGKWSDGKHFELVGGKQYWLDSELADEYIIKGYCTGNLSREYTEGEREAIMSTVQVIGAGGLG